MEVSGVSHRIRPMIFFDGSIPVRPSLFIFMLDPFGLRIFSSMAIAVLVCSSNLALKREGRDGEKYSARVRFFQAREKTNVTPYVWSSTHTTL